VEYGGSRVAAAVCCLALVTALAPTVVAEPTLTMSIDGTDVQGGEAVTVTDDPRVEIDASADAAIESVTVEVVRDDGSGTEAELRSALDLTESRYLPNSFEYDGGLFYLPDRDEFRDHPSDYVTWYRDLMAHEGFEDTEFTYAVTKADLALRDYRAAEREHGNQNPLPLRNYDDFRHHVVGIVQDASNLLSQDFDEPEKFRPLWYEVEDPDGVGGDELRITTADMDTIPVLRGSEQLLTKLER
jgi:hypothetical protein